MPNENGKGLKATKWKVIGTIIVAAIPGIFATFHSTCSISKTASDSELKSMVTQLNTIFIPAIQKMVEEIRYDAKQDRDDAAAMRERIAKLEGTIEGYRAGKRSGKKSGVARTAITSPNIMLEKSLTEAKDRLEIKAKSKLPTLKMQYQQMGPSLEGVIRNGKDD